MRPRRILGLLLVLSSAGCGDACSPAPEPSTSSPQTRDPQDPGPDAHPTVKALHSSAVDLDKIFGTPPVDASAD